MRPPARPEKGEDRHALKAHSSILDREKDVQQDERRKEAAIMAGLRLLQAQNQGCLSMDGERAVAIDDIATSGGEFDALSAVEIDDLCEDINLGQLRLGGDAE